MRAQEDIPFEDLMKPGVEAFNFWISFFPTAPLFGVEWRFGESMEQFMPMAGVAGMTGIAKTPAPKTAEVVSISTARARVAGADATDAETIEPATADIAPEVKAKPAPKTAPKPAAPKKAAAKPAVEPVAAPDAAPTANDAAVAPKGLLKKAPADADDLKLIKGVGPGLEKQLNALGIYRFRQLSKFKQADLEWVDANLTSFKGRCFRDDWVGQAKALL